MVLDLSSTNTIDSTSIKDVIITPNYFLHNNHQIETGFKVYSLDRETCNDDMLLSLHRDVRHKRYFDHEFYLDRSHIAANTLLAIKAFAQQYCENLPNRIRIVGTIIKRDQLPKYHGPNRLPYERERVYSGKLFVRGFEKPYLIDDDPEERTNQLQQEFARIARYENYQMYLSQKASRERKNITDALVAMGVGYVQGVNYELADEALCGAVALQMKSQTTPFSMKKYEQCHNYLNDKLDEVKQNSPWAFKLANLLGVMNNRLHLLFPEAKTRAGNTLTMEASEFLACVATERFAVRLGEVIDYEEIYKICTEFTSIFNVLPSAITGPQKK